MKGIGRATTLKLASQGADIVLSDVQRAASNLPPQEAAGHWRSIDSVAEEVEALGCADEKLVAFSSKRRGFCPSCGDG